MLLQVQQKNIASLTFIIFIEALSFYIVLPVLYFLVSQNYDFLPTDLSQNARILIFAALVFSPLVAKVLLAAVFSSLSDTHGRRNMLLLCMMINAVGCIMTIVGILLSSLPLLFLGRLVSGASSSSQMIAKAAIADFSQGLQRIKYYSSFFGAFSLALLIGPHIGIMLTNIHLVSWFDLTTPFWISLVLVLFNIILLLEFYRDAQKIQHQGRSREKLISFAKHYLIEPTFIKLLLIVMLCYGAWMIYYINTSLFLGAQLHYSNQAIGLFMSYFVLLQLIGLVVTGLYLSKKFQLATLVHTGILMAAIGYMLSLLPGELAQWFAASIIGFAAGINCAALTTLIADIFPEQRMGLIQGLFGCGAILSGIVVAGLPSMLSHISSMLPTMAAILCSLAAVFLLFKELNVKKLLSHGVV